MLGEGREPKLGALHSRDEYVWRAAAPVPGIMELVRAYYYVSVVGDEPKVQATIDALKAMPFSSDGVSPIQCMLYPRVHKKAAKSNKTSTVDIQLAVDMLTQAHQSETDALYLFSGDADFIPLVDAVAARGKRVILAAFTSGLSAGLKARADSFVTLDHVYFQAPTRSG